MKISFFYILILLVIVSSGCAGFLMDSKKSSPQKQSSLPDTNNKNAHAATQKDTKHITGKEETIEQRLKKTHSRIKEIIQLEDFKDENIPMKYFKDLIYKNPESSIFEKKVAYIQRFEET